MAAPITDFQNAYALNAAPGGGYTVASEAPSLGPYVIQDTLDSPLDNLSELGDVPNDAFSVAASGQNASLVYIGETHDGESIVGSFGGTFILLTNSTYVVGQIVTSTTTPFMVCFASGTQILTARGDVAVEHLAVGDLAVTAAGAHVPIKWLGHRAVDCRDHRRPNEAMPVRIAAHAFGPNRPARDLYVSPGHSICVDVLGEVLIPAIALVNGTTITQVEVETVTYWHVELDNHDIIIAENLPAESYLEMGNRTFFAETNAVALHALPDAPVATHADFCRPFVAHGPMIEAVKAQLEKRAIKHAASPRDNGAVAA